MKRKTTDDENNKDHKAVDEQDDVVNVNPMKIVNVLLSPILLEPEYQDIH